MVKDAITVRRVHTVPGQLDCAVPFVGTECGPGVALQPGEMFFSFFLHAQEGFTRPAGSNRLLIRRRLAFGRFGPAVWALSPQGARPVMQAGDRVDSCTGILVDWTERPGHGIIFGLPATFNSGGATYPLTASVIRYASYVEVLLDLALPDEVLVEPGDTLMLAPGCQVCAEAGLEAHASQDNGTARVEDKQTYPDAWQDDCPAVCPTFPHKHCGKWVQDKYMKFARNTEPKFIFEYEDMRSDVGLGEALDSLPFEWAIRHEAGFYWSSWMKPYWCSYANASRMAEPSPDGWKSIKLSGLKHGDGGHRLRYKKANLDEKFMEQLGPVSQVQAGLSQGMAKIIYKNKATTGWNRCSFFAFTCPSTRVARPLGALLAKLPARFAALHFRAVGAKAKDKSFSFLRSLGAVIEENPALSKKAGWRDHVSHVDEVLSQRCEQMPDDFYSDAKQSACHCATRFESLLKLAVDFTKADNEDAIFPMFFATDLPSVSNYVRQHMSQWLIQSEGESTRKTSKMSGGTVRLFVDFQAFSLAEWTISTRQSSQYSLKPARLGFGSYVAMRGGGDDCLSH
jgi:hypothetical protein